MSDTSLTTVATNVNKRPIVIMRERFESRKTELKNMLPSDVSPDVFIRAFTTSATLNPDIQACTWASIWEACVKAARAGLLPDGVEGAIVPYGSKATWIPMVQGVLRSARRSGQLNWIDANVVRQGEQFEYAITQDGPRFLHVPGDDFKAPILRAYAVARTKDGAFYSTVMPKAEIDKHRAHSRAQREDSPWQQWFEAMAIKTAIKGLGKFLPSVRDAIGEDDLLSDEPQPQTATASTQIARAPGAAAALEQFSRASPAAGDSPHPVTTDDATREEGGEQGTVSASAAHDAASGDPAPVDDHYEHFQRVAAYKRGQEAKAAGHARKAIPGEYRESDRTREALAWEAGWSGQPLPEFSKGET